MEPKPRGTQRGQPLALVVPGATKMILDYVSMPVSQLVHQSLSLLRLDRFGGCFY